MDYHIRRVCWKTPNESVGLMFSVYFTTSFISRIAFQGQIGQFLLILIIHVHSTSMLFMVFDETLKQCCLIVQPSEIQNESIRQKSLCYAVGYTPWALVEKLHTHQYTFSKIIRLSTHWSDKWCWIIGLDQYHWLSAFQLWGDLFTAKLFVGEKVHVTRFQS